MPVDVFISYRGADRVLARRLEQRLRSRWGIRVFRDETSLMPGRPWSEQLLAAMSQANVTLALVGPGWHVREKGEDWVRDELLGAIKAGNPVLPDILPDRCDELIKDLFDGRSMVFSGASGSGRGAFLQRVANAVTKQGGLLASSGTNLSSRSRRTHCVIASWVDSLFGHLIE